MRPLNLFLAFDFYGAGNLGDDLMIAGLLTGLREIAGGRETRLVAHTPHDIASQRLRFPSIEWMDAPELSRWLESREVSDFAWVGAGGTPFQSMWGPWMTRSLQTHAGRWGRFTRRVMTNVGAEREAASDAAALAPIARGLDRISTRDEASLELLRSAFDVRADRLLAGSDLAHVAMDSLVARFAVRPPDEPHAQAWEPLIPRSNLGLIAACYMLARHEVEAIGAFVQEASDQDSSRGDARPIAWIAQEVRAARGMERHTLQFLAERFANAASDATRTPAQSTSWRERVRLMVPAYADATLEELLLPIADCEVVLSSRYHGLLAAAWLGKRVAGFGNTSKVATLARDLGVPHDSGPLTSESLHALRRDASTVQRDRLEAHRSRALEGLRFALDGL